MSYDEHSIFGAVKKCWLKNWVLVLYYRCYANIVSSKSFQSDNHVYCDSNKSTLDFLSKLRNCAGRYIQLLYDVIHQVKVDMKRKFLFSHMKVHEKQE